ncbi:hypothetical protein BGZ63DRAFT_409211 [Mariannaea sp. PMI_226]|nr:hypothetical protein BGZ63DRAFT_409211 [Mariannaea sp. PMI_226]
MRTRLSVLHLPTIPTSFEQSFYGSRNCLSNYICPRYGPCGASTNPMRHSKAFAERFHFLTRFNYEAIVAPAVQGCLHQWSTTRAPRSSLDAGSEPRSSLYRPRQLTAAPTSLQSFFQATPQAGGVPRDPAPLKDRAYQARIGQELLEYSTWFRRILK